MLKWFAADIGYHNIHHLSARISNYNLEACHKQNRHLLADSKMLKIADIPDCFKFILWDSASSRLVSIASFRQTAQFITDTEPSVMDRTEIEKAIVKNVEVLSK